MYESLLPEGKGFDKFFSIECQSRQLKKCNNCNILIKNLFQQQLLCKMKQSIRVLKISLLNKTSLVVHDKTSSILRSYNNKKPNLLKYINIYNHFLNSHIWGWGGGTWITKVLHNFSVFKLIRNPL